MKFLPINAIEAATAHTHDFQLTIYFRNAAEEKHSEMWHRYRANELRETVEREVRLVESNEFAPVWAASGATATCVRVYCWKTHETLWFSLR